MIIKRKNLFLGIYFITMLCLFFSISDLCVAPETFAKIKYVFIAFCLLDILSHRISYRHLNIATLFVFVVYICFSILYGKIWVTEKVLIETNYQYKTTLLFLLLSFFVYYEMEYYRCFKTFMYVSFMAIALFLLFSYANYIEQSSFNPFYVFKFLFNDGARGRAQFGLQHWNYIGFYVYVALIISVYCLSNISVLGKYKTIGCYVIIFVDYIMYLMIVSASSRGGIVAFGLFCVLVVFHKCIMRIRPDNRLLCRIGLLIVGMILIVIGINLGIFEAANGSRELNISKNMPIFRQHGDFWKGMGWVENGALQEETDAFGLGTSSLDMFYVYVYFTTGFVGCIFMSFIYGTIGIGNLINYKRKDSWFCIFLFISILFYSYWDTVLFTIKLWPGLIIVVVLFHGMGRKNRVKIST